MSITDFTIEAGFQTGPDVPGAFKTFLEAQSLVTALAPASRIRGEIPKGVSSGYFIRFQQASIRIDDHFPLWYVTLAIQWYAPSGYLAGRLWDIGHAAITGRSHPRGGLYVVGDVRFRQSKLISGPISATNEVGDWHYKDTTYLFEVDEKLQ